MLNGELDAMVGGHHLAAAWALVVLYDYHNGVDFAETDGLEMSKSMFALFDREMAQDYLGYLAAGHPEVDYCRFSKVCNPELKAYDFFHQQLVERCACCHTALNRTSISAWR
ncbi:hypothetical protein ULG90_02880 [Halopseudomonas pachastrellae]|nr:hypothetical protein ULG90_02880 [Halopseudomonas pachastrellae]